MLKYTGLSMAFVILIQLSSLCAADSYSDEQLFLIPWGEDEGELSLWWKEPVPPDAPDGYFGDVLGPCAISETAGIVIVDKSDEDTARLTRYSINGVFIRQLILNSVGLSNPDEIAIHDSGYVLLNYGKNQYILDPSLHVTNNIDVPVDFVHIWPSNNGFWCFYTIDSLDYSYCEDYIFEYYCNGFRSEPVLLYSGNSDNPSRNVYGYVNFDGDIFPEITDQNGCTYESNRMKVIGVVVNRLVKRNPFNEIVFSYDLNCEDDWANQEYYIMWSGDFITHHGTEDGLLFKEWHLHHNPVCRCRIVTSMPYSGPSPAAIEFDTSGTFDEDGDDLTYHWDFDGDCIFDEPVDDSYTGDPDKPTHEYNQSGEYTVNLMVTDNYQGKCETAVIVNVRIV